MPRNRNRTDPGQLRNKIVIKRRQAGQDTLGQPLDGWIPVVTIWGWQSQVTKVEENISGRSVEARRIQFRVRAQDASRTQINDRAVIGGQLYTIVAAMPVLDGSPDFWTDLVFEDP